MPCILRACLGILLLLLAAQPGTAEPPPGCTPKIAGALHCMAGQACRCGFARGGLMTSEPSGWRWDCGVLQGGCPRPSGELAGSWYELPPGFSIDQSDQSIRLDQSTGVVTGARPWPGRPGFRPPIGPLPLFPDGQSGHDPSPGGQRRGR
ncbi:hypothetical protein [Geminicoccus flavidas]|uniref:hypothetical protein n=1 Tax=Geminicoccus flavidas TaxID=2506407 RepID=UPI00135BE470|nr:hypothetical protein [Geminicoccus flavidas]